MNGRFEKKKEIDEKEELDQINGVLMA